MFKKLTGFCLLTLVLSSSAFAGQSCMKAIKVCQTQVSAAQDALQKVTQSAEDHHSDNTQSVSQLEENLADKKIECAERIQDACS